MVQSQVMRALCLFAALLLLPQIAEARVHRSHAARCHFLAQMGYPDCHTPKGYIVDHVIPLCAGGPDKPENMQLQTVSDAKAKDRKERKRCRRMRQAD